MPTGAKLARLRREVKRLEQENEVLKRAAALPLSLEPVGLSGKFAQEAVAS